MAAFPPINDYLADFCERAEAAGFEWERFGEVGGYPLLAALRVGKDRVPWVYLSAGVHGDEPAGSLAILPLLGHTCFHTLNICVCPLLNPLGMEAGTRENAQGLDINRDYPQGLTPEASLHMRWLAQQSRRYPLALHLHEDCDAAGFYLYEITPMMRLGNAYALLKAARPYTGIDPSDVIDGRPADRGRILLPESLEELPIGSEAVYMAKRFSDTVYTTETPTSKRLEDRICAHVAAVVSAVESLSKTTNITR